MAALLPAWHSGYVLGVLKYKYHPFLPTISFSPPHQGIAYHNLPSTSHPFANRFYQHTSNFFSSNFIEITSKKNKNHPSTYHTTPLPTSSTPQWLLLYPRPIPLLKSGLPNLSTKISTRFLPNVSSFELSSTRIFQHITRY